MSDVGAPPAGHDRAASAVAAFILLSICLLSWPGISVPTIALIVHLPDDCFYYLQIARNLLDHGFSSFDGRNFTNGYQPLWMLVCVLAQWASSGDKEAALRLTLFLQVCLSAGAMAILFKTLATRLDMVAAAVGVAFWLAASDSLLMNGLETGIAMLAYVCVISVLWRPDGAGPLSRVSMKRSWLYGLLLGVLFLARTDAGLVIAALSALWIAQAMRSRQGPHDAEPLPLRNVAALLVGVAMVAGPYLATNLYFTGHIMPVSGAAKTLHADMVRRVAEASTGRGALSLTLENVWWAVRDQRWALIVGLLGIPLVALLRAAIGRHRSPAFAGVLVPISIGILLQYLYYGVVFYGHSQTSWYYGPTHLMTAIAVAIAVHIVRGLVTAREGTQIGLGLVFALAAFGMGLRVLPVIGGLTLITAGLLALAACVLRPSWSRAVVPVAALGAVIVLYRVPGIQQGLWTVPLLTIGVAVAAVSAGRFAPRPAAVVIATALLIWPLNVVRGNFLQWRSAPDSWNSGLYTLAIWLSKHSPPGVTVASYSAGILGYFSNRTVVNLDGLVNSFDYLYDVWQPQRVGQYVQQFDLTAEANPLPLQPPPGGCVVGIDPPPKTLILDGRPHQVTLFQFRRAGPLPCAPLDGEAPAAPEPSTTAGDTDGASIDPAAMTGTWNVGAKKAEVKVEGGTVVCVNENGGTSKAEITGVRRLHATEWRVSAVLSDNGKALIWSDGSVWTR